MENILYLGPYREFSGMGNASRMYLKSLIQTGNNISIRPTYNIYKEYPEEFISDEILGLETNFSKKYHTVIQHCYPHQLCYNNKFEKHVGIIHLESQKYNSNVLQFLDIMDYVVVGSDTIKNTIQNKIKAKTLVIPEPIDLEKINSYEEKTKNNKTDKDKDKYFFYIIGDWILKKNIEKAVLCFIKLSSYYKNIELVIKTKSDLESSQNLRSFVEYDLSKIYNLSKGNVFKKPKILIGDTSLEALYYIHKNNDCLINISSGESFGYSVLEAMAFKNNIVTNKNTSMAEIVAKDCGLCANTETDMCLDNAQLFPIYNTNLQTWQRPILSSVYNQMEKAINETPSQKQQRQIAQEKNLQNYSIDTISNLFSQI